MGTAVAGGPQRAAIEAAPATRPGPDRDYLAEAKAASTQAEALAVFQAAKNAGAPWDYLEQLKEIGTAKPATAPDSTPAQQTPTPDAEGVYEVEVVEDPADVQGVWFQILAAAGQRGLSTEQVEAGFAQRNGGLHPSNATVAQMTAYLAAVKAGEVR